MVIFNASSFELPSFCLIQLIKETSPTLESSVNNIGQAFWSSQSVNNWDITEENKMFGKYWRNKFSDALAKLLAISDAFLESSASSL